MSFSYANPTSGPSAGGIGWMNFGNVTLNPGDSASFSGTLNNGVSVSFDLSLNLVSGTPRSFSATTVPTYPLAQFGSAGYTGLAGNVAMYSQQIFQVLSVSSLQISNVVVKDTNNVNVPNYTVLIADAEDTNLFESIQGQTNGEAWKLFTTVGTGSNATLSGIGTSTFDIVGNQQFGAVKAYVLSSENPTSITLTISSQDPTISRQGFAIGFATTQVKLQKNIGNRIDASDQFVLDINGNPSNTITTSGNTNGIQTQVASIFATPGNTYTLNESMALGSASTLSDYTQIISASNATPAGSMPPITALPISFTPDLGDDVTYQIINAAPQVFTKAVNKAYADIGDILTYSVTVENPNDFPINNVLVTDMTPAGTVYIGNLNVSTAYTGTDLVSGITILTIGASSSATITWQVQVNMFPPIPNPIPNYANVVVPNGTSGMSNVVTTQVNTAHVGVIKSVDKAFATVGDILTYTLTLNNGGNVSANNVTLTDVIPSGTTYVPNSLTGATGTPPLFFLNQPIAPNGSQVVTFQVQVDPVLPIPNPIENNANVTYFYTVDPAKPNEISKTAQSNTVETLVNLGSVTIRKSVDKAFAKTNDVLTYTLVLQNTGNVLVDNVVIQDVLPNGTTYVANSLIGAVGVPPTLTLTTPMLPGDSVTVSFQVLVGPTIPNPNPLVNDASVDFNFTIDPVDPNGGSGSSTSNEVETQINEANVIITKSVDQSFVDINGILTYTLVLQNIGNVAANNVLVQDAIPAGTTFINGSLFGAIGTPPLFALTTPIPANSSHTITFQVQVNGQIPSQNPLLNSANTSYTFTTNPNNPDGETGDNQGNTVTTQVNHAEVFIEKEVDKAFASIGDILTYTITLQNIGNTIAKNITVTDAIPAGTSYVAGSLVGATGPFPTLTLLSGLNPSQATTIRFQVKVDVLPTINPIPNDATVQYAYQVDPNSTEETKGSKTSNTVYTLISIADLPIQKSVDKQRAYPNDILTYTLSFTNVGNVPANNVVLQDILANGLQYVPNSIQSTSPISGVPPTIQFLQPIAPHQSVQVRFQVKVIGMPNPNPIINQATLTFSYVMDPNQPEKPGINISNKVCTIVFRNRYTQEISDLIQSVALEQAALSALANEEGAKIQSMVAMDHVSSSQLLCLNHSVTDMIASISMLETILTQKLKLVECQINGSCDTSGNC